MKNNRYTNRNYPRFDKAKYLYGKNTVYHALLTGRVVRIFLAPGFSDQSILEEMKKANIAAETLNNDLLQHFEDANHQGVLAETAPYFYKSLEEIIRISKVNRYPLLVLADQISDPQNLGAIIRNIEALGGHGLIIKKDQSAEISATVAKVASGALDHVPVCQVVNLSTTIEKLKKEGFWIVGAAGEGQVDYRDFDYKSPIGLVVGSEGKGISPLVKSNCDLLIKIPMRGNINSLNASAATAVILSEIANNRFPL